MKVKSITRSVKDGLLVTGVDKARFITLVGSPANQRAFSVMRDDGEGTTRVRRTKRSDAGGVASVTFPAGYTEESATEALKNFGLVGFELAVEGEVVCATRSDLQSIAKEDLTEVRLTEDGVVASVIKPEQEASAAKEDISMAVIRFDSEQFSKKAATDWLTENGIDFDAKAIDNSSGTFVLQRMDVPEGEEVRHIELAEGVTADIIRSDICDIPAGFVMVVCEAAYSGWGWGHYDFNARLADVEVGEKLRKGLYMVDDVLRDILFHSALPVDDRKTLALRTLNQFGTYIGTLLDQLPRQLLVSVTSDIQRNDPEKEEDMSGTAGKTISISEDDLDKRIAAAIRADREERGETEQKPAAQEEQKPADKPAEGEEQTKEDKQTPAGEETKGESDDTKPLTRSDVQGLVGTMAAMQAQIEKLSSTTIVRSDTPDPKREQEPVEKTAGAKRSDAEVGTLFKGTLNLGGR